MAITYSNAIKDARMTAVLTALDAQTAHAYIEICTTAYGAVLSTITLGKPSFTEGSQALTLIGTPSDNSAAGTGTAAVARIKDGASTVQINNLTVGISGTDIILGSVAISTGEVVQLTSGVINHAA